MDHLERHSSHDLTEAFRRARARGSIPRDAVDDILRRVMSKIPTAKTEWDDGVPENWAQIRLGKRTAFMSTRYPLVLLPDGEGGRIAACFDGFEVVEFQDAERREYSIESLELSQWFGQKLAGGNTGAFSCEAFSIDEIWWATVAV